MTVSVIGVGCNAFGKRIDADATNRVVNAAVDQGINLFDTADMYGGTLSEEYLGRALGKRREDVVIATKFGGSLDGAIGPDWDARGSRRYIRKAVEASLRRLGTDWIDLYQLHFPDPNTPIQETLATLSDLVREGKVRYIGSSNFAGWQVVDADWTARTGGFEAFVSAQNKYSLYEREAEKELIPALEHVGAGLLPWGPLSSGLLTGKYKRGEEAPAGSRLANADQASKLAKADFDRIEAIERFAAERGITMLDVAIGGLAAQPSVASVIAGAAREEQIAANISAASWEPTAEDLVELDKIR